MVVTGNHYGNRRYSITRSRFLITLLFFNSFLGCIYYIHEQSAPIIMLTNATNSLSHPLYDSHLSELYGSKDTKALGFIRQTLANEYNRADLQGFYQLVQREYYMGLKCTRDPNISRSEVVSQMAESPHALKSHLLLKKPASSLLLKSLVAANRSRRYQRQDFYPFVINNSDACRNEPVDLLIIIISKSENYKTRDAIRRTWGSGKNLGIYSSINVKYFFLLDLDEKLRDQIRLENDLFQDIIQVELPQQYTLVTHRVLSLFEWSFRFCRTAKYLFKTDDDIFINLILLLKFLAPLLQQQPVTNAFVISDMYMYGYRHHNPIVFRSSDDPVVARYVVTHDEFPCEFYPDFLSGFGYLISKKARDAIVYTAYQDPEPFRISDVYLTGIIPDYLSIPRQLMSDYHIRYENGCEDFFNQPGGFACAAGAHYGNASEVFDRFNRYWYLIKENLLAVNH